MTMPAIGQLRRVARRTFRKREEGILILLYHRVASLPVDPFHLAVSREHFAEHLNVLQKNYPVLKLEDALRCTQGKSVPGRSVVITFDDGYRDLLDQALPVLKQYSMPATAFITSGYIGSDREPWWDELENVCLAKDILPGTLDLELAGAPFHWERPHSLKPPVLLRGDDDTGWRQYMPLVRGWREQLYHTLYDRLKPLPTLERDTRLGEIFAWAGVSRVNRHTHQMLSERELRTLADDGTIEIGAHTVHHVSLASAPIDVQKREISESKMVLERLVGREVIAFAYPHGAASDYTHQTTLLVQESGFTCACSAFYGIIRQGTGLFELPRYEVHDWDGAAFAGRLDDWWRG